MYIYKDIYQAKILTGYAYNRRGAMVLFTAPEDMVIGQACNITEREPKGRPQYEIPGEIISRVKTTSALKQGVLGYNVSKVLVCVHW